MTTARRKAPGPSAESLKSWHRKEKCVTCGEQHFARWRRPKWCLECDMADRLASGWSRDRVAAYLRLPLFLVERLTMELEGSRMMT